MRGPATGAAALLGLVGVLGSRSAGAAAGAGANSSSVFDAAAMVGAGGGRTPGLLDVVRCDGCESVVGHGFQELTQAKYGLGVEHLDLGLLPALVMDDEDLRYVICVGAEFAYNNEGFVPDPAWLARVKGKVVMYGETKAREVTQATPECDLFWNGNSMTAKEMMWLVSARMCQLFADAIVVRVVDYYPAFSTHVHATFFTSPLEWWEPYRSFVDIDRCAAFEAMELNAGDLDLLGAAVWGSNSSRNSDSSPLMLMNVTSREGAFHAAFFHPLVELIFRGVFGAAYLVLGIRCISTLRQRVQDRRSGGDKAPWFILAILAVNGVELILLGFSLAADGYSTAGNFPLTVAIVNRPMFIASSLWTHLVLAQVWDRVSRRAVQAQADSSATARRRQRRFGMWSAASGVLFVSTDILVMIFVSNFIATTLSYFIIPVTICCLLLAISGYFLVACNRVLKLLGHLQGNANQAAASKPSEAAAARGSARGSAKKASYAVRDSIAAGTRKKSEPGGRGATREQLFVAKMARGIKRSAIFTIVMVFGLGSVATPAIYYRGPTAYLIVNAVLIAAKLFMVHTQVCIISQNRPKTKRQGSTHKIAAGKGSTSSKGATSVSNSKALGTNASSILNPSAPSAQVVPV